MSRDDRRGGNVRVRSRFTPQSATQRILNSLSRSRSDSFTTRFLDLTAQRISGLGPTVFTKWLYHSS
ncbi:hypothetical protein [Streptomyces sp. NBC_00424]|uniref:8-oxoguanine DNA glycosylase OGG fold protein n=1 Tax=unclassified Streptomyces TaxID=2593676 RepID=UPI003390067B